MPREVFQPLSPTIAQWDRRIHRAQSPIWNRLFPSEIIFGREELERAEKLNCPGKYGLGIVSNHITRSDGPRVILDVIFKNPKMLDFPVLAPIAYHQYNKVIDMLAKRHGVILRPIVTPDTIKKGKNRGKPEGWGFPRYIRDAVEVLRVGGIVFMAPQSRRMAYLEQSKKTPVAYLLDFTDKKNVENVALLPIGIGIKGVDRYDRMAGLNFGRSYTISIGPLITKAELRVLKTDENIPVKPDDWVFEQLKQIVPNSYLKTSQ